MVYAAKIYDTPLLPFEKQLINNIGATEEEYRYLVTEAIKRSGVRPAGYEHIPDIQNTLVAETGALTALGQLVVGVALTAVSYLLTPKPKQPKVERRELDNINKAGRFNPTFGFDSQAELATYGEPISLIFGDAQYRGETYLNGGMLISPKLVWSRMFSYGTQQAVKLAFVVGEQGKTRNGIEAPLLSGIFLGNNPLDSIYSSSFAFYWCRHSREGTTGSRITTDHKKYGTRGRLQDGDPDTTGTGDRVILCPTADSDDDTGFSAVHSLSNNVDFGCYAPIPNGSAYKVNWRVVNWIKVPDGTDDPGNVKENTIIKIAGNVGWKTGGVGSDGKPSNRWNGMPGTGRWYSRRMGIKNYHGDGSGKGRISCSNDDGTKIINGVRVNDKIEFHIAKSSHKIREDLYGSKVKVDDINAEIASQRMAADDAMQIGEVFQIGKTVWQVYKRTQDIWTDENDVLQRIWLVCIDDNDQRDNRIGIISDHVFSPSSGYISDSITNEGEVAIEDPGPNFFPLLRRSRAVVKNTRACETTEIGIRSKVNQQLSGICNFQSLLSPYDLGNLWRAEVSVTNGTITSFIKRASLFSLRWRDGEVSHTSDIQGWRDFGITFAVIGINSVDQYNWIRIRHPAGFPHRYEYQLNPIPGAGLYGKSALDTIYSLNALASDASDGPSYTIEKDGFRIQFNGEQKSLREITKNREFLNGSIATTPSTINGGPSTLSQSDWVTGKEDWDHISRMTAAKWVANWGGTGNGPNEGDVVTGYGRGNAFCWEVFGNAATDSTAVGAVKTVTAEFTTTFPTRNKPVKLILKAEKRKLDPVPSWMSGTGVTHGWVILGATADTIDRINEGVNPDINEDPDNNLDWTAGTLEHKNYTFRIQKSCAGSNPWAQNAENGPLAYAGISVEITGHDHIHDVIRGKGYGVPYEIFGNAMAKSLNDTKEVEVVMTTTGSMSGTGAGWSTNIEASHSRTITVKFRGTVIDIRPNWTGRSRGWRVDGIDVVSSTGTWNKNETFNFFKTSTSASNPYWRTQQGALGYVIKINDVNTTHVPTTLTADREFESESQYSDISFYGGLVRKSNESSPEHSVVYVNEMLANESYPKYDKTTTAVLALKASRSFSSLDQMRVWLKEGIRVERLHPDEAGATGASNLFTDLVYYLFTDRTGGAGQLLGTVTDAESLIDKAQLVTTSRFLRANELFFNGAIAKPVNLREYISEMAPKFLCDFVIADGRFSLRPSVPVNSNGEISLNAVEIKQLFTTGNILEDSFSIQYIDADERRKFQAVVRYREEKENQLPIEKTVTVRHAIGDGTEPIETFDLTDFCTTKDHAILVGKYFLTLRKRVTHSCNFSTTPSGLDLGPGDFIRVTTETSPYNAANNGTISASGVVTSARTLENGTYNVLYYSTATDASDVEKASMTVHNGSVADGTFHSSIFSVVSTTNSQNVYRVEQLTLNEENIVEIVASEYPCDSRLVSLMARDLKNQSSFVISS